MRKLAITVAIVATWSSTALASPMFAVLPLDVRNTGGKMDAAAVASLEEMLRDSASNALTPSGWKVLTGENMIAVLRDNGIKPEECGDASCHVNAAREIKVDWFISGSVQYVDGKFTASIRLLESHAGQILATANLTGTTTTDLKAAFQKQAADFFSRAGIVAGPQGEDQKTGDLFLRVDPSDATYQLDDDTPVPLLPGHNTILTLPLGRHRLVVKKSGFQDSRRDIFIDRGQVQTVEITLLTPPPPASPKPGHAYLTVDSTPPQAHIFLDGQDTGKLSPATFSALDAGQHQVVLQRDLYRDTQQRFTLTGEEVKLLKVNLTPNFGTLSIQTEPPGATVTVDGKQQPDLTPLTREKWEAKAYRVRLSLPQYETVERTVVIPPGDTATVKESLKPTFGTLTIRTKPDGATVYLDDVQLTETTPTTREHLGARIYRLRITAPLYADLNKAVTVERGKTTVIDENLHPTFGQVAVAATVNGQPLDGADVLINGQSRGVTPLTLDRVPEGSTTVEVRAPLHRAWTGKILVQSEQTVHVAAVLTPE